MVRAAPKAFGVGSRFKSGRAHQRDWGIELWLWSTFCVVFGPHFISISHSTLFAPVLEAKAEDLRRLNMSFGRYPDQAKASGQICRWYVACFD